MDNNLAFKKVLLNSIAKLSEDTPEARERLFRKIRHFVATSKYAPLAGKLEAAIAEVEGSYPRQVIRPPSRIATGEVASARADVQIGVPPVADLPRPETAVAPPLRPSLFPSRKRALMLAAGLVVIIAAPVIYSLLPASPDPEFDGGVSAYSDNTQSFQAISAWSTYYSVIDEGQSRFVQANGTAPLYSRATYPVDTQKTYEVTARIRVVTNDPTSGHSVFSVGVKPLGDLGTPEGYRIHGFGPQSQGVFLTAEQGWTTITSVLTGVGQQPGQFYPGTRDVRLAVLMNESSPGAVAQVDFLRFREIPGP